MAGTADTVATLGGIACLTLLRERGVTARQAGAAVHRGELIRLRNGWFALPTADHDAMRAVRSGGQLTAASRLGRLGLWMMPDDRLHVSVACDATRLRHGGDACLHWRDLPWDPPRTASVDSVLSSIARLIECSSEEAAIVTIDSALNTQRGSRHVLEEHELAEILAVLPRRFRRIARLVDPASQSGLETLARLRLRRRGLTVRSQVQIPGVGFVDLLIGDRLVLELDSRSHHLGEDYEKDRWRDLELSRRGYIVIRVSYRRVMEDWASVEASILDVVRRGEHRRRAMHRRLGLALN
jgi:very-short-patch-repair endonuclease